jgi:hypothetical protein
MENGNEHTYLKNWNESFEAVSKTTSSAFEGTWAKASMAGASGERQRESGAPSGNMVWLPQARR